MDTSSMCCIFEAGSTQLDLLRFFKLPYPYYYSFAQSLAVSVGSGMFVFLFLITFQPFGTYNFQHPYKTLFLAGYGMITTLVMIAWFLTVPLAFPAIFKEERWTIGKQLALLMALIATLGSAGYFYQIGFFGWSYHWQNWLYFIALTVSIGFFPVLVITWIDYTLKLKAYSLPNQTLLHQQPVAITSGLHVISDDQLKEKVVFTTDEFLFVKASDNYIEVFLRVGKIDFEKKLIRCTLKRAEAVLLPIQFLKCHRSYVVNMNNCTSIQGNPQGYKLLFEGVPELVPVSRAKKDLVVGFIR